MAKRLATSLLVLALQMTVVGSALGQDFAGLVSAAATANRQWVDQITAVGQATNLTGLQSANAAALASGQRVQSLLQQALPLASDDASRSRLQGVLQHVTAAVAAACRAQAATTFDQARSALDAERGEAVEASSELAPFAQGLPSTTTSAAPVPTTLPRTGSISVALVGGIGLLGVLAGATLRRLA